jgi:leader peptidase (prepilin peptidase)/N-methyltransferase
MLVDFWLLNVLIALLGVLFGSFVTAWSYRLPRGESILAARSRCVGCEKPLRARDLIPVLSWVMNKGRCGQCGAEVSIRYPLTEIVQALLFLCIFWRYGLQPASLTLMALSVCLLTMSVIDLEHGIIPDLLQLLMLGLAVLFRFQLGSEISDMLVGAASGFAVGLSLHYGYYFVKGRHGLGFGDVKFLGVVGCFLGWMLLSPFGVMSGLMGIGTAFLWKAMGRGRVFPFGPALAMALYACLLLLPQLSYWFRDTGIVPYWEVLDQPQ